MKTDLSNIFDALTEDEINSIITTENYKISAFAKKRIKNKVLNRTVKPCKHPTKMIILAATCIAVLVCGTVGIAAIVGDEQQVQPTQSYKISYDSVLRYVTVNGEKWPENGLKFHCTDYATDGQIEEMNGIKRINKQDVIMRGYFTAAGLIPKDAPRLTLQNAKELLENMPFGTADIIDAFNEVAILPDEMYRDRTEGCSYYYYINDEATEYILVKHCFAAIVYYVKDGNEELISPPIWENEESIELLLSTQWINRLDKYDYLLPYAKTEEQKQALQALDFKNTSPIRSALEAVGALRSDLPRLTLEKVIDIAEQCDSRYDAVAKLHAATYAPDYMKGSGIVRYYYYIDDDEYIVTDGMGVVYCYTEDGEKKFTRLFTNIDYIKYIGKYAK